MEEKILIKSKTYKIPKSIIIFSTVILLALSTLSLLNSYSFNKNCYKQMYEHQLLIQEGYTEDYNEILEGYETKLRQYTYCYCDDDYYIGLKGITESQFLEKHPYAFSYAMCRGYDWYFSFEEYLRGESLLLLHPYEILDGLTPLLVVIIILFIYWWISSYEITVSNKRIYGKASFGKRVDLPVDSISAISTSALKGIAIATASGKIVFKLIKNRDEIHSEISSLIIKRQSKQNITTPEVPVAVTTTDELKKYKELLDMGAITQEEFDIKKKELLGF